MRFFLGVSFFFVSVFLSFFDFWEIVWNFLGVCFLKFLVF